MKDLLLQEIAKVSYLVRGAVSMIRWLDYQYLENLEYPKVLKKLSTCKKELEQSV